VSLLSTSHSTVDVFSLLTFAFVVSSVDVGLVHARRDESFTVNPRTYKRLETAQDFLKEGSFNDSREILEDILKRHRLSSHEKALVYQSLGNVAAGQERIVDAIKMFNHCLTQQALPTQTQQQIKYHLGQLYIATEQYKKAVDIFDQWLEKQMQPSAHADYIIAGALARVGRFQEASALGTRAVSKNPRPPEPWLRLLASVQYKAKNLQAMETTLTILVERFPKRQYWLQLAGILMETGQPQRSLALLEIAYGRGFLDKGQELLTLARHYLNEGLPHKGALFLEQAMQAKTIVSTPENLELLSRAWSMAGEFPQAVETLKEAVLLAGGANLWLPLAKLHFRLGAYKNALEASERCLDIGPKHQTASAWMLIGMSNLSMKKPEAAKSAFEIAELSPEQSHNAQQWLEHIASKIQ
jgi:tetratricopeptide (TPR) repeat protein